GFQTGGYRVEYVDRELSLSESIALQFAVLASPVLKIFDLRLPWSEQLDSLISAMLDPLEYVGLHNDPRGLYSYCFCDVR
ncbi:MAG TPA: hypothetical protein VKQ06_12145, partial [Gammaproteobacteria bacterium]|nr:hypothetical protein [Gammaproteobacteria bacterium]